MMSDAPLINGFAGAGGGIIAQLLTYPLQLQTVNARQQTERETNKENNKFGTFQYMSKTRYYVVKHEGWGRLYGGLAPSLVGTASSQTHTKSSKKNHHRQASKTPEEIIAAIEPPPYGTSNTVQEVYSEAGFWGCWKGVIPTLIMVSNPSMQFMLYETLLKKVKERRAMKKTASNGVTALEIFLLGAVAKLGATVATYPLLVVKSRLQAK